MVSILNMLPHLG